MLSTTLLLMASLAHATTYRLAVIKPSGKELLSINEQNPCNTEKKEGSLYPFSIKNRAFTMQLDCRPEDNQVRLHVNGWDWKSSPFGPTIHVRSVWRREGPMTIDVKDRTKHLGKPRLYTVSATPIQELTASP